MNATVPDPSGKRLLEVQELSVRFAGRKAQFRRQQASTLAVDRVSFVLGKGEVFGLVGESGSGKTSLARALVGLVPSVSGSIRLGGRELAGGSSPGWSDARRRIQIVFQDPGAALSPRRSVEQTLREPLVHFGLGDPAGHREQVVDTLQAVGLDESALPRYPHQFSSGQRQRIAIARALIVDPEVLIADEAVSALDVSVQARVLNLLASLRAERGIAMLFISHDLAVIRQLADTVGIMYRGRMVELAPANALFQQPVHPYTGQLLNAVPDLDQPLAVPATGVALASRSADEGCGFRLYCPRAMDICKSVAPELSVTPDSEAHRVECHLNDSKNA